MRLGPCQVFGDQQQLTIGFFPVRGLAEHPWHIGLGRPIRIRYCRGRFTLRLSGLLRVHGNNDTTATVGHDEILSVQNARTRTVKEGDETVTLGKGKRSVAIQTGSISLTIKGGLVKVN